MIFTFEKVKTVTVGVDNEERNNETDPVDMLQFILKSPVRVTERGH